ncbi:MULTISPECIES: flavin reductase family protein [Nonomuraea]|uniref:Flavin reductase family protein n=1 Tax=Nonomuraea ferruginea TaxID=46174 RepID=A0ABT4TEM6_9ACTN|nr:flavin reductase family protein [Nonomuraea ferruginea]MDA0647615.1 flavin reductase family protein [Nonomuraea ferruginea]
MSFSHTAETGLRDSVRSVLRRVPATVVVVTSFVSGRPWGVTASSFSSVTLDPPIVSICLFSHTAVMRAARLHGRVGVSVLSADQVHVARAAAAPGAPKFLESFSPEAEGLGETGIPHPAPNRRWDPHDGAAVPPAPSVHGALAHFDCAISQVVTVGDHDVLFARVERVREGDAALPPLLYFDRDFYRLPDDPIEG